MAEQTLEEVELWLAVNFPELREIQSKRTTSLAFDTYEEIARGWVPNVTTDGLLEALTGYKWQFRVEIRRSCPSYSESTVFLHRNWCDGEPDDWHVRSTSPTTHEALCRAAQKALE